MKKNDLLFRLLSDWILICIGVLGSLYCLTTAEAFELRMPALVPILVPALALLCCLLFQGKSGKYYALGVLGLLLLVGWLFRAELIEGLRSLWASLIQKYTEGYGYSWLLRLLPKEPCTPEAAGVGIAVLACFETCFCALSVRLWKRTTPAAFSILPGVAACFVLANTLPARLPILAVAFSILTQAFSQSARRRSTGEHSKAILLSALVSAALLGLLLLFLPDQKDFQSPFTWDDLNKKLERWHEEQNNIGNINAGLYGNPEEVDLDKLSALPNRADPALYVTASETSYLYLRGSSYMDFDGSSWSRGALWDGSRNAAFPYLNRYDSAELSIETHHVEGTLYTTYQLTALPAGGTLVGDAYIENSGDIDRYSMRFRTGAEPVEFDEAYDAWVREKCLRIPERTGTAVLAWWEAQEGSRDLGSLFAANSGAYLNIPGGGADDSATLEEYIARQAARLVSETAKYSRNPDQMPADAADFCEWFLNEAEEGYCVHFASACTALLRALGIPSRYVSGYVCQARAGERVSVSTLQAHAWVEIWTGGRWIVIEPTPDYATEFSGILDPDGSPAETETAASTAAEAETTPAPEVTKPQPIETTAPTESPETTEPAQTEPDAPAPPDSGETQRWVDPKELTGIWILVGLILILGRRTLILRLRERRIRRAKPNDRARLLYRYILRLQKRIDSIIPPEAEELARKAAYSQHELDEDELAFLRQVYEQQKTRLARSGILRRLWCKYVLAVI